MDIIALKKYQTPGEVKPQRTFVEFFINDQALSDLLNIFYHNSSRNILDHWIGVLGSWENKKNEILKLKQLLGKNITDEEVRQAFPKSFNDSEFQEHLERYREELSNPGIIIYCCAECGGYDCGGIAVTISKTDSLTTWTVTDDNRNISFNFNKHLYYDVFNSYMTSIKKESSKV